VGWWVRTWKVISFQPSVFSKACGRAFLGIERIAGKEGKESEEVKEAKEGEEGR
jgi:hypothetical protein